MLQRNKDIDHCGDDRPLENGPSKAQKTNKTKIHLRKHHFDPSNLKHNINSIKAPEFYEDGLQLDLDNIEE